MMKENNNDEVEEQQRWKGKTMTMKGKNDGVEERQQWNDGEEQLRWRRQTERNKKEKKKDGEEI